MQGPVIDDVKVSAYCVPTDEPEADGTLRWDSTEMVLTQVSAGGRTGLGYSYTAALPAASLIRDKLAPRVKGIGAFDLPLLWQRMNQALRNTGRPGLGMMAIAALDQALWDLKARLLDIPLVSLWGFARQSVPVYGSGGFTTYGDTELREQISDWQEQGIRMVKIKLGTGIQGDLHRLNVARRAAGGDMALMVDANGAYCAREAVELIEHLHQYRVVWLEEPVSSDDLSGLRWLRDRAPSGMSIAAGEYGWDLLYFHRMLASGAVDVLQADATRCGFTGFLQAAQLCEVFKLPLSAHCAPAIHASVCAAVPRLRHLEYFHDHVRIETLFFGDGPRLEKGELYPNRCKPGHGLTLREQATRKYQL